MDLKRLLSFLFIMLTIISWSSPDFDKAKKLIDSKKFESASSILDSLIQQDPDNLSYFYNYGWIEYNRGKFGNAIWNFEKALQLNPKNNQTILNLELCHQKLDLPLYTPIHSTFMRSLYQFGSNSWAAIGIGLIIIISLVSIRYRKLSVKQRKIVLYTMPVSLILTILVMFISFAAKEYRTNSDYFIVIDKNIPTYMEEDVTGPVNLSEGNRVKQVEILNENYSRFELPNGQMMLLKTTEALKKL